MRHPLCVALFITLIVAATVDQVAAVGKKTQTPFGTYKEVEINDHPILVDPLLKHAIIKIDANDEAFGEEYGAEIVQITCNTYKIDIGFTYGPSDDPSYQIIVKGASSTFKKTIDANDLAVSSTCQFYASGKTDKSFDMKQKYVITKSGIQETVQPYYLVDMTCSTSAVTTLTTEHCGKGSTVANLPKGSEVRILASEWFQNDEDGRKVSSCGAQKGSYLVSTPFGLVGWVENEIGDIHGRKGVPLSCIIFNGD